MTHPAPDTKVRRADFLDLDKLGLGILIYSYAVLLGAAYVFGYWRTFGFDIFPFMSPLDYVSAPLNRLLVLIAAPLLLAVISFPGPTSTVQEKRPVVALYLVAIYAIAFVSQQYEAVSRFFAFDFSFQNEKTVLSIASILFVAGVVYGYRIYKNHEGVQIQLASLLLLQVALSLSAGYSDGKAIFNGAGNVMFLENKNLCEEKGLRDWVLVGKFTDHTFFMNTIDKRLCITSEKSYKLVSRKYKEGL